jgi:hypothetical protein
MHVRMLASITNKMLNFSRRKKREVAAALTSILEVLLAELLGDAVVAPAGAVAVVVVAPAASAAPYRPPREPRSRLGVGGGVGEGGPGRRRRGGGAAQRERHGRPPSLARCWVWWYDPDNWPVFFFFSCEVFNWGGLRANWAYCCPACVRNCGNSYMSPVGFMLFSGQQSWPRPMTLVASTAVSPKRRGSSVW